MYGFGRDFREKAISGALTSFLKNLLFSLFLLFSIEVAMPPTFHRTERARNLGRSLFAGFVLLFSFLLFTPVSLTEFSFSIIPSLHRGVSRRCTDRSAERQERESPTCLSLLPFLIFPSLVRQQHNERRPESQSDIYRATE